MAKARVKTEARELETGESRFHELKKRAFVGAKDEAKWVENRLNTKALNFRKQKKKKQGRIHGKRCA